MWRKIINQISLVLRSERPLDIYVKLRRRGKHVLLAMCDAELLGRTLKQGKTIFHVHEKFYKGALVSVEEAAGLIRQASIVNMIGEKVVKKAVENGFVHPEAVLEIDGVPHTQILKL